MFIATLINAILLGSSFLLPHFPATLEVILVSFVNMARIKLAAKLALEELLERTCVKYTGFKSSENETCEQLAYSGVVAYNV